jgi:hypothetical protein
MGLFDRFFKKEETLNCDWCGSDFSPPGVESDGMTYCGESCMAAVAAPVREREQRDVHASKQLGHEDIEEAMRISRAELQHFKRKLRDMLGTELVAAAPGAEAEINQAEFEFWRGLDEICAALMRSGANLSDYDELRRWSVQNSIELRESHDASPGIGLGGPKIRVTKTVTADFSDTNIQRMADAISALAAAQKETTRSES